MPGRFARDGSKRQRAKVFDQEYFGDEIIGSFFKCFSAI
jgi:hypothetical protein